MGVKFMTLDSEFVPYPNQQNYKVLCFCVWADGYQDKFWVLDTKEKERFINFILNNKDIYFIAHHIPAECYSLLSLQDTRINAVYDELKWIDTKVLFKCIFNTDGAANKVNLSLANLVKELGIYDYGEWKNDVRKLILTKEYWNETEQKEILEYCLKDCEVSHNLFKRGISMFQEVYGIKYSTVSNIHTNYLKSSTLATYNGYCVDKKYLGQLKSKYYKLVEHFFNESPGETKDLFDYSGMLPVFKYDKFENKAKLHEAKYKFKWELTDSGKYSAASDYLKKIKGNHIWLNGLYDLLKQLRGIRYIRYDVMKQAIDRITQLEFIPDFEYIDSLKNFYNETKKELGYKKLKDFETGSKLGNKKAHEAIVKNCMANILRKNLKLDSDFDEETNKKQGLYESITESGKIHADNGCMLNFSFRAAPRASNFLPAMSSYLRSAYYVPKGWAMVFTDIVAAENIAGAILSGDQKLLDVALSGDPYIQVGYLTGMVKKEDSNLNKKEFEEKYPKLRTKLKILALSSQYGATEYSLAMTIFGSWDREAVDECLELVTKYRKTFSKYYEYQYKMQDLTNTSIVSRYKTYRYATNYNSAGNFHIQGSGAEVLMEAVPKLSNFKMIDKGIIYNHSIHDEIILRIKDDEKIEDRIQYIETTFKKAMWNSISKNKHNLINKNTGKLFCQDDLQVESDIFYPGDLIFSKDKETAIKIRSILSDI